MNSNSVILSHPFCAAYNKPVAQSLYARGALKYVVTGNDFTGKEWLKRWVGEGPYGNRQWQLPNEKLRQTYWPDLAGRLAMRVGFKKAGYGGYELTAVAHDKVARKYIREAEALYAYEDSSLAQFLDAKQKGMKLLYELPLGFYREVERRSAQAQGLGHSAFYSEPSWKIERKEEEARLADVIVSVSYYMAEKTREFLPHKKIITIPYLMPAHEFKANLQPRTGPLKLIYIGSISDRKGILELLGVWKKLAVPKSVAQLTLVGGMALTGQQLQPYRDLFAWVPYMSRSEISLALADSDLFVFPTWCDGYGLVLGEALACGTPVLSTAYSGAYGVVQDGIEGWVYQAGSEALQERLEWVLGNPDGLRAMRPAARALAEKWSFDARSQEISNAILAHAE